MRLVRESLLAVEAHASNFPSWTPSGLIRSSIIDFSAALGIAIPANLAVLVSAGAAAAALDAPAAPAPAPAPVATNRGWNHASTWATA